MNFTSLTTAIALDTFLDSHPLFKHFCLFYINIIKNESLYKFI